MKRIVLIFLFIISSPYLFGQQLNKFLAPTDAHRLIEGTSLYIIPPLNFLESKNFKGFQNPLDPSAMIMVTTLPAPFPTIKIGFTSENLKAKGMQLTSKEDVILSGLPGMLVHVEQESNGNVFSKVILIFGDQISTTLINGVFIKGSRIEDAILSSIKTAFFDQTIKADPRAALNYTLDEKVGNLKFLAVMGNGFLINRDGKKPTLSPDKVSLVTDKSYAKVQIADQKNFALNRIKGLKKGEDTLTNVSIGAIEIDQLKGYQILATNKKESQDVCQVMLFPEDGGYYLFAGFCAIGNKMAMDDIIKVILTFRRK